MLLLTPDEDPGSPGPLPSLPSGGPFYQLSVGVDDAIIFLLDRSLSHLRIMFFDFSTPFKTIQPALLGDKLELTGVDQHCMSWILDYLTNLPQYVRIRDFLSHRERSWPLSCSPCTLQTSTTNHPTAIEKSSLTTLLSSASSGTGTTEHKESSLRTLSTGASRTTFSSMPGRPKSWWWISTGTNNPAHRWTSREWTLRWWHLTNTWEFIWTICWTGLITLQLHKRKGQSRLHLLRKLRSFGVQGALLTSSYDSVVTSDIFYGVVHWSSSISAAGRTRLDNQEPSWI